MSIPAPEGPPTRAEILARQRHWLDARVTKLLAELEDTEAGRELGELIGPFIRIVEDHAVARHGLHLLQAIVGATYPAAGNAAPDVAPEDMLHSADLVPDVEGPHSLPASWPWEDHRQPLPADITAGTEVRA